MSSVKKNIKLTRHVKKSFTSAFGPKKEVEIILRNLAAEVDADKSGEWTSKPTVYKEKQIMDSIVDPFAKTAANIESNLKGDRPNYIIDFDYKPKSGENNTKADSEKNDQKTGYVVEKPRFPISRVILPEKTKTGIEIIMSLIKHNRLMYQTWNLASIEGSAKHTVTINLYGPSGTGKTLCAEAIAHELKRDILPVKYPQLESSLVGETNKNIHDIFKTAREKECVIFFDEADSILGKRLSSVTQSADHGINMARSVMLIELEKFDGVVIFATNFVKNYDSAFARRLLHFVKFDMPDHENRYRLFQIHIPEELPLEKNVCLDELARLTVGFSGGDIRNVILKTAAKAANQNLPDAEKKLSREHFIDSIEEINESKRDISGGGELSKLIKSKNKKLKPGDSPDIERIENKAA
ncbi:ATP-binding protein [Desulfococcaceae bacterium HSG7]|nr:ATP-binding protein [Desulfococcaceae bacterium HSG7]